MAMKCSRCGAENPEGKKFCGDCGSVIMQLERQTEQAISSQYRSNWLELHWKATLSVVVVVLLVMMMFGLVATQSWSKMKVLVAYNGYDTIEIRLFVDREIVAFVEVHPSQSHSIIGSWPVDSGVHNASIDYGYWTYSAYSRSWSYTGPDGESDFFYAYTVGHLTTKNVFIFL